MRRPACIGAATLPFRHIGTSHDDNAVGVGHAPGIESCCAAAESGPQTGDTGAVSYPHLILDSDYSQTAHQFLAKMIELDLQGRAAKGEDRGCPIDELAVGKLSMKVSSRVFLVSSAIRVIARSMSHTSQSEAPAARRLNRPDRPALSRFLQQRKDGENLAAKRP